MKLRLFALLAVLAALLLAFSLFVACGDDDDDDSDGAIGDDDDTTDDDTTDDDTTDDDTTDDDDDDDDDDEWDDTFFPPADGPLGTYRLFLDEEETDWSDQPAEVIGDDSTTFPGETYTLIQVGDFSGATNGLKGWFDFTDILKVGIKRGEAYSATKAGGWNMAYEFDEVLVFDFSGDVGETITNTGSGELQFPDKMSIATDFTIKTTVTDDNATIEVPYGEITGCLEVHLETTETTTKDSFTIPMDFYLHPEIGIIQVDMVPGFMAMKLVDLPE